MIGHLDAESKKLAAFILIHKVVEFTYGKDKSALLVYFVYALSYVVIGAIRCC